MSDLTSPRRADPMKSDYISATRQAAAVFQDAVKRLVELNELGQDRGYGPEGDNPLEPEDFTGLNAAISPLDFLAARAALNALQPQFTPELRRVLNRIRP